jgi:5'' nucleotidase, deoxy (Pyrimidine), cytosolic type C protein (NT5C).
MRTLHDENQASPHLHVAVDFDGVLAWTMESVVPKLQDDDTGPEWFDESQIDYYEWVIDEFGAEEFREVYDQTMSEEWRYIKPWGYEYSTRRNLQQMANVATVDVVTKQPSANHDAVIDGKNKWLVEQGLDTLIDRLISVDMDVDKSRLGYDVLINDCPYYLQDTLDYQTLILIDHHYNRPAVVDLDPTEYIRGTMNTAANIVYMEAQ